MKKATIGDLNKMLDNFCEEHNLNKPNIEVENGQFVIYTNLNTEEDGMTLRDMTDEDIDPDNFVEDVEEDVEDDEDDDGPF